MMCYRRLIEAFIIDRLTRSLADFAKLVEAFDARSISFVAVTQQFNTTTSMGRLTLNVLLSFAQFERELSSERVRDKIAASRRKGEWTGGTVPLGYDARDGNTTRYSRMASAPNGKWQRSVLFDPPLDVNVMSVDGTWSAEAVLLRFPPKKREFGRQSCGLSFPNFFLSYQNTAASRFFAVAQGVG